MTFIQQFIEKAFVGGWQPVDRDFRIIGFYERYFEYELRSIAPGQRSVPRMMAYEAALEANGMRTRSRLRDAMTTLAYLRVSKDTQETKNHGSCRTVLT